MRSRRRMVLAGSAGALVASAAVALAGLPNVICTGGPCSGTPGPDEIAGTQQRDVITAKAGSDFVEALEGNDKVDLGPGNDEVSADTGADELFGGRGSDRFSGSFGPDVMHGGPGDEREVLSGRRGGPIPGFFTFMFGDPGNDKIYGEGGRDFMEGEEGADLMSGGRGADFLDAIDDDDDAVDRLRCGKGRDRYTAGPEDSVSASCEIEIKLDV